MSLEDFALASSFPQMAVIVPCDVPSMMAAMAAAVDYQGPAYVRSSREAMPLVYENGCPFELGKANLLRDGSDVTLIACGLMVGVSMDAAALLARGGHLGPRARHAHGQAARPRRRSRPPRVKPAPS